MFVVGGENEGHGKTALSPFLCQAFVIVSETYC